MARQIQIRRGTTLENDNFTGAIGEVTMDTDAKTLRVHDGETMGGIALARKDEISNITNFIIPDYSSGIVMDMTLTEQNYVCPSNGVIVVDTTGFDNTYGYLKINGVNMFNVTTNGNLSFVNANAQYIVGAGDIITYKSGYRHATVKPSLNLLTFYPFRSAQ